MGADDTLFPLGQVVATSGALIALVVTEADRSSTCLLLPEEY